MSAPIHVQAAALVGRYGMHLVEVPRGTKVPRRDRWQVETISTPEAAEAHWLKHPTDNIGVVLGPSRLCSIDVDDAENTRIIFSEFGIDIDEYAKLYTSCRGNPARFKVFFRVPEGMDFQRHVISWPRKDDPTKKSVVFEIRGGAGQDILPPSVHPDGYPYEWICKPNGTIAEIPERLQTIIAQWDVFKKNAVALCPWTRPPEPAPKPVRAPDAPHGSVIDAWDAAHDLEAALLAYGYEQQGRRFLSPHSGTKLAGVSILADGQRCWIHHASDPLCSEESGKPVGAFDLFCHYEHHGDVRKAVKAAAEALGLPALVRRGTSSEDSEWIGESATEGARVSDWTPNHRDMIEVPIDDPEPVDLFLRSAVPPLNRDYLPPAFAAFVMDQSALVGSDPCILAVSTLVCAAACCHDSIDLLPQRYDRHWRESARLWGAFVGDPSVKKTPAANRAKAPLKKIDIELGQNSEADRKKHALAMKAYTAREGQWIKDQSQNRPTGDLEDAPERPPKRRLVLQDSTIEAVAEAMIDNPGGLLVDHDELSGFFGSMDVYRAQGNKDAAFWLKAYDGGPMRIDRIGRGSLIVPNVSACILGGIQPGPMREIAGKLNDDGLLQRFMVVMASDSGSIGEDRPPDRFAIETYRSVLSWLHQERGDPDNPVTMSDGAYALFRSAQEKIQRLRGDPRLSLKERAHFGKYSGLLARLALVFHAIEHANDAKAIAGTEIDADTMTRAALLVFDYLKPHAHAFYESVAGDDARGDMLRWVAGWILSGSRESFRPSDLVHDYRELRRLTVPQREELMRSLEALGWVSAEGARYRGSVGRWRVNPKVHSSFADRAQSERVWRVEVKREIVNE